MALLIDSSVFIGLERHGLSLGDLSQLGATGVPTLASITAAELLSGVERSVPSSRRTRRLTFIEQLLAELEVLAFDLQAARTHARISASLIRAGTPIGPNDLIIAATALAHGHTVMTDNLREFALVPGLPVLRPTWPG